jgi:hypothetical protein
MPSVRSAKCDASFDPAGAFFSSSMAARLNRSVRWWQDFLTPGWKRLAGGCRLNRAIGTLIEAGGFQIERIETGYMRGPRPLTFMYEGSARPH